MSTGTAPVIDQAQRLLDSAALLPVDEAARVLEQAVTMLQAGQARLLADAERSGALKDSGCATVRSFAATVLRRSAADAAAFARTAHGLEAFPRLTEAYQAGLVSTPNVRMVMAQTPACGLELLQRFETELVDLATKVGPGEIKQFCQFLADLHRPDRDEAKVRAAGLRQVRITRVGALAHLDAMLDPVVADRLKAALAGMAKASRTSTVGVDGHDVSSAHRTYAERSADALEDVLTRGMDEAPLPARARQRAHATVSVSLETLLGLPGQGRSLLHRFGLIPSGTAARVSCDALVRILVTHGRQVLAVGRTQRVVTRRQHAALAATYQTCVMPGCAVSFADCEVHHLWWWSLGGPTDLGLQVPLCRGHHQWLHDGGYTITRDDGVLVFRDPKGRVIANSHQILGDQLDLLAASTKPATAADLQGAADADAHTVLSDVDAWASTPYDCGTWGWTGRDPAPPPGHAPPRDDQPPSPFDLI
jgi:hypothetical protein